MKLWHVTTDVLDARGWQVWSVRADTAEEACRLVDKGEGEFVESEIEVTQTGQAYGADLQVEGGAK